MLNVEVLAVELLIASINSKPDVIHKNQPPFGILVPHAGNSSYLVFDAETQVPFSVAKHKTTHVSVIAAAIDETRWMRTTSLVNDVCLETLRDLQHRELLAVLVVSKVFKFPAQFGLDLCPARDRSLELAAYEPTGS